MSRSAVGKLIHVCAELRKSAMSGARALSRHNGRYFDNGTAFGIEGVCRFELDVARARLHFQFGSEPEDAVEATPDGATFVLGSDGTREVEPLGFLRGRLLECAARSTRPPPPG